MVDLLTLGAILGVLLIGAISPGPSFVLVARTAVAVSRRDGLAAAAGMGLGAAIFGALALGGLQAVLAQVAGLYVALKLLGGLYLVYLAVRILRGAAEPLAVPAAEAEVGGFVRSFRTGLATQLSNPKTAVVFTSVFAAVLPADPPFWLVAILPPLILLQETAWYALVALAFSAGRPRAAYVRSKVWVDRVAGAAIGLLGVKLVGAAAD